MSFVFELPEVGEGVVEAEIARWLVEPGAIVQKDQPLVEVTTDKAQLEISSPRSGRVAQLHGKAGDILKVHSPLVTFDDAAAAPAPAAPAPAPAAAAPAPAAAPPPAAPAPRPAASVPAERTETLATPAVRRHARELEVDLAQVPGTGPKGRVTHQDLAQFQAGQEAPPPAAAPAPLPVAPPALPQARPSGAEERIKIAGVRRKIAEQMVKSKRTAPHFTYVEEIDASRLVDLRDRLKGRAKERGVKLTYLPLIMKATSLVMREFPNVNAVMDEEASELVVKADHHFGVSCDTPFGLYVPVVRSVDQKSVLQVARDLDEVVTRTRAGKARLEDLKGGTFTLTSVGNIGGVLATPILNHPEVAILGVNAIRDRAVVVDGAVVVRPMFYLSPSFDHRIIDGAVAARFVAALKQVLENPEALLLELS